MVDVQACWRALEAWLEANHPDGTAVLAEPATADQVAAVESTLGVELPASFVAFLRRHDGQTPGARPLFRRFRPYSTASIEENWEQMAELLDDGTFDDRLDDFEARFGGPDEGVRDVWWSKWWVPFAQDASGNFLCLDLDPAPVGDRGQVIAVWHDMPTRPVRAPSFDAWLSGVVDDIEAGQLVYSEQTHSMMAEPHELDSLPAERIEGPSSEDVAAVFRRHEERRSGAGEPDNWFVELCFEHRGEVGPTVQSQWGMLNLASLAEPGQTDRAETVLTDEGFEIESTGDLYVTAKHSSLDAEHAVAVVERVLDVVYDTALDEVAAVRERTL